MRINKEPYQPTEQQIFWCNECDSQKVDSNDETSGKYFIVFGHSWSQSSKQYDGEYTGVMFTLCCNCLENAGNT